MRVNEYTEVKEAARLVGIAQQVLQKDGSTHATLSILRIAENKLERTLKPYAPKREQLTLVQEGDANE